MIFKTSWSFQEGRSGRCPVLTRYSVTRNSKCAYSKVAGSWIEKLQGWPSLFSLYRQTIGWEWMFHVHWTQTIESSSSVKKHKCRANPKMQDSPKIRKPPRLRKLHRFNHDKGESHHKQTMLSWVCCLVSYFILLWANIMIHKNNPGRNCKSWQVSTSYEIWWHDKSNIGAFTIVFHGFW
jgi:hypothetical protein